MVVSDNSNLSLVVSMNGKLSQWQLMVATIYYNLNQW